VSRLYGPISTIPERETATWRKPASRLLPLRRRPHFSRSAQEGEKEMPMMVTRAIPAIGVAALLAFLALGPRPAAAGPLVYQSNMACLDVFFDPLTLSQGDATATAKIEQTGPGNANLLLTFKSNGGLPPNAPVVCGLLCVVDGDIFMDFFEGLFDSRKFDPCGTTTAGGKLTATATLPDFAGDPFRGGCLVPIPAFWIIPEPPIIKVPVEDDPLVVCAPGFGTFPGTLTPSPCVASNTC
jgi:hypothetical protein